MCTCVCCAQRGAKAGDGIAVAAWTRTSTPPHATRGNTQGRRSSREAVHGAEVRAYPECAVMGPSGAAGWSTQSKSGRLEGVAVGAGAQSTAQRRTGLAGAAFSAVSFFALPSPNMLVPMPLEVSPELEMTERTMVSKTSLTPSLSVLALAS